jgi:hypothetical protein
LGDGINIDPWLGPQSQTMVADWAPRYSELARKGMLFNGANQAGQAVSNLSTTATGLILINPLGSGKNLWIVDIIFSQSAVGSTAQPVLTLAANTNPLALGSYTLTTSLTINSALLGSTATPVGKLLSSATLPAAPVIVRSIWNSQNNPTAATSGVPALIKDEVAGAVGIIPGCAVSLSASAALSGIASKTWCELPI